MRSLYHRLSASWHCWWEIFGDWAPPRVLAALPARASRRYLTQERFDLGQRRARKRRAFVQRLNCTD